MNQSNEWIHYGAGMVYMKEGHYKAAEQKFRELLSINPTYGGAYAQLGIIYDVEGRKKEAKALLEKAIIHDPDNVTANFQLGILNKDDKDYKNAIYLLNKVLKINPFHVDAMINLGIVYSRRGGFEKARKLIHDAYNKDQTLKDCYALLGRIKAEALNWGGSPEVLELIDIDRKTGRLSTIAKLTEAKRYIWGRRFEDAENLVREAYQESPKAKAGYGRLATAVLMIGDQERAMNYWQKDRTLNRENARSAARYDFMKRPEWKRGSGSVLIYQLFGDPDFATIEPLLGQIFLEAGNDVIIEVPKKVMKTVAKSYPGWKIMEFMVFSEKPPPMIPDRYARLSYYALLKMYRR